MQSGRRHSISTVRDCTGQVARDIAGRLDACGIPVLALLIPLFNVAITVVWLQFSHLSVRPWDAMVAAAIFAGLLGMTMIASRFGPTRALAGVTGTLAVVFGGFAASSFPSALGAATGGALWDKTLLHFDRMVGVDHAALYDYIVKLPHAVDAMSFCYGLTVLFVPLTAMTLVVLKRYDRLREFNLLFATSLAFVVLAAALVPSAGLFTEVRFTTALLQALPEGSGTYHLDLFYALRAGTPMDYGPFDNPGLIVFPSFHTCMALLVLYGLRDDPVLKWPAGLYCAITLVATVPYGSHYVADLVGGAAIFAACAWSIRRREWPVLPALRVPQIAAQ